GLAAMTARASLALTHQCITLAQPERQTHRIVAETGRIKNWPRLVPALESVQMSQQAARQALATEFCSHRHANDPDHRLREYTFDTELLSQHLLREMTSRPASAEPDGLSKRLIIERDFSVTHQQGDRL